MKEIWKEVEGYNGLYFVSNLGNVKSLCYSKSRILKPYTHRDGYLLVVFCNKNKRKTLKIHRLVAMGFIPNLENKLQVNHINGIKTDNRVENLEWCTRLENIRHSWQNELSKSKKGEEHFGSKLVDSQVLEIRQNIHISSYKLAEIYGVSRQTIDRVKKKILWKHL